ncbi:hypothetical protein F5148DRAFT_1196697 [Russula earlei]|uniref:Uncharacterized protein n=1 Tax=Russula earlei TaxID=71964 RepID=A0ACC0UA31_9AGAM|nr:hypothetical protein F5148DRAFT_1196697 [Russula earlei]
MHTSSIFAIFCLVNGIVPSLALPSGFRPRGKSPWEIIDGLVSEREKQFEDRQHRWDGFTLDRKKKFVARAKSIEDHLFAHHKALADEELTAAKGNHKNAD